MNSVMVVGSSDFYKKLDWSTFTAGMTVPIKCQDSFLKNLSVELIPGNGSDVTIYFEGQRFDATIHNVGFSDLKRPRVIQFHWSPRSPLALFLQAKYATEYKLLLKARKRNKKVNLSTYLDVRIGKKENTFELFPVEVEGVGSMTALPLIYAKKKNAGRDNEIFQSLPAKEKETSLWSQRRQKCWNRNFY